eukprot:872982-Pleurochrysis_carterae.AAC.4
MCDNYLNVCMVSGQGTRRGRLILKPQISIIASTTCAKAGYHHLFARGKNTEVKFSDTTHALWV